MTIQDAQGIGVLRPMAEHDLEMVLEWRNAPKVRENMYTQQVISLDEHQKWWARMNDQDSDKYLVFEADGLPAGVVSFVNFTHGRKAAEWGFYAAPTTQRGIGSRLGLCALDYAFGTLALTTLFAEVLDYNSTSLNFHKKLGFQDEKLLKKYRRVNGVETDVFRMKISADQWQKTRPQILEKRLRRAEHD